MTEERNETSYATEQSFESETHVEGEEAAERLAEEEERRLLQVYMVLLDDFMDE